MNILERIKQWYRGTKPTKPHVYMIDKASRPLTQLSNTIKELASARGEEVSQNTIKTIEQQVTAYLKLHKTGTSVHKVLERLLERGRNGILSNEKFTKRIPDRIYELKKKGFTINKSQAFPNARLAKRRRIVKYILN